MKRLLRAVLFLLFVFTLANSQTATVKRNVVLRSSASSSSKKITTLQPSAELKLINPAPRNGFLHVQTDDGGKGWVFAKNVEVSDEEDADEDNGAPLEDDIIAKLLSAHVDAVGKPLVIGGQTVCGPFGTPGNDDKKKALNTNKNRTDTPSDAAYVKIDWADLRDLPVGHATDLPGAPVVFEGFLVHKVKPEGAESPNCSLTDPDEVDWHIYTSDTAGLDDISRAVIVETTARTRPLHNWAKMDLDAIVNKNVPVRISGWLLYDYEHVSAIGTQRASVWEIHPITKIEIKKNGNWIKLGE